MKKSILCAVIFMVLATVSMAATLDTARQYYNEKDYKSAASEYGTLLTFNWPKAQLGELYDAFTECLVITGNYELAERKIDAFSSIMPGDPLAAKLAARKVQIAHERSDSALVSKLAADFVAKYTDQNDYYPLVQQYSGETSTQLLKTATSSSLESALQSYQSKNYADAATQYESLLTQKTSGTSTASLYDGLTECLMITGKYADANEKIDAFVKDYPSDPLCEKLAVRKAQMAYDANNYTSTTQLAKEFLSKYSNTSQYGLQAYRLLVESYSKSGQHQQQIDFIEEALDNNPTHPMYAELRRKQADTLSGFMKNNDEARIKYTDALKHVDSSSETYEACAYRLSEITRSQATAIAKSNPQQADELTSQSRYYLNEFLNHPGWGKVYPVNAKKRILAFRELKQYDAMEEEAAKYISDQNHVQPIETITVKNTFGTLTDFKHEYDSKMSSDSLAAIREMKYSLYGGNYATAITKAKDFMTSHSVGTVDYQQAQGILITAMRKNKENQKLAMYIDQALTENPAHPSYGEIRRIQADALFDLKQMANAQAKYVDAMAHTSNDTEAYEWSCYRAGDVLFRQAVAVNQTDAKKNADLKVQGRNYLAEYVKLPSKDSIYPGNVKRRLMALIRLGQTDQMELEAAQYLSDLGAYNEQDYITVMLMLSANRARRSDADQKGALAAFEELRLRENNFADKNAKVDCGLTMVRDADYFAAHGGDKDQVEKLRETGRRFLQEAVKDESLKISNRLNAYYFLKDCTALKAEATKNMDSAAADDSATRAEMSNWIGVAMGMQDPPDYDGAIAAFDRVLLEYEKNPQAVKDRATIANYWALSLEVRRNNTAKAREYFNKMKNMPDSDIKQITLKDFAYLNAN